MRSKQHLLAALAIAVCITSVAHAEAIAWRADLDQARQEAAQSGKMVLIHFWKPSCGPCVKLENEVFNQPSVAQAIEASYVPVKLNTDEFRATTASFGVKTLPTDVILAPAGQVVASYNSPLDAPGYTGRLAQIATANPVRPLQAATTAAATGIVPTAAAQTAPVGGRYAGGQTHAQPYQAQTPPPAQHQVAPAAGTDRYGNYTQAAPASAPAAGYAPAPQQQPPVGDRYAANPAGQQPAPSYQTPPGAQAGGRYAAAQHGSQPSAQPAAQPATPPGSTGQTINNPYANIPVPGAAQPHVSQPQPTQPAANNPAAGAPALPAGAPPLGLEGYCPVSLVEKQSWNKGNVQFGAIHLGRTYLFSGQAEQQRFLANPDVYAPALTGNDPVLAIDHGQSAAGYRRHGVYYRDQIYLFSSEETLARFSQNPERYVDGVRQAMQQAAGQMPRR